LSFRLFLNRPSLASVASFTKQLDVTFRVGAAFHYRNNVIKLQTLTLSAADTLPLVTLPDKQSHVIWYALTAGIWYAFKILKGMQFAFDSI
jgi:hypothetical protein